MKTSSLSKSMGDCRIRIQISKCVVDDASVNAKPILVSSNECAKAVLIEHDLITIATSLYSADTSTEEVFESTTLDMVTPKTTLRSLIDSDNVSVWDCTTYPPINITQLCGRDACRTRTLYTAGWYPSGYVQILPIYATNAISTTSSESYDDIQFNNHSRNEHIVSHYRTTTSRVQIINESLYNGGGDILPSQVLHSVTQRFDHDDDHKINTPEEALRLRQENKRKNELVMQSRHQKLDAHIQRLNTKNNTSNKGVSDQVLKMLIKSRAMGLRNSAVVQIQDRVYLHCIMWYDDPVGNDNAATCSDRNDDTGNDETYIYVSIQDTIGRVLDTFSPNRSRHHTQPPQPLPVVLAKEMLSIRATSTTTNIPQNGNEYQRLPSTLRFYEVIERQLMSKDNVNHVIIRFFDPRVLDATSVTITARNDIHRPQPQERLESGDDPAPTNTPKSIGTDIQLNPQITNNCKAVDSNELDLSTHETITVDESSMTAVIPILAGNMYNQLWDTVGKHIVAATNTDPNKPSAKEKVRQMQMKSKAIGDAKRIKMLEHRLFFQLTTTVHIPSTNTIQVIGTKPVFVSRFDFVQRIASDQAHPEDPQNHGPILWELLLPVLTRNATIDKNHQNATTYYHKFRRIASSSVDANATSLTWKDLIRHDKVGCFGNVLLHYNFG